VFKFNPAGLAWARAVLFLTIALVPLVLFAAIGHQEYLLSAQFGALFAVLSDPGGPHGSRVLRIVGFAAIGAGVTALAFGIGGDAWGWLALAAFAVTLAAGLAATLGVRRFVVGLLLSTWFIIALSLAFSLHHQTRITQYTWAQVLAWVGGSALWIVAASITWLILGRHDRPQPVAELPGDTSRQKLTRPIAMFAVIRALAIAGTVAIAFGTNLSHGLWMPIAASVAMKPSLEQSTTVGLQRIAGALMGVAAAILLLLIPANEHGLRLLSITLALQMVALAFFVYAVGIRFWNYAFYYGAISTAVLLPMDLLQPTNYSAEGYRVAWALCGVAIAVLVMLLADLLGKRTAKAPPGRPADVPAQRKPAAQQDLASPGGRGAEPGTPGRRGS
jgi:hypothetical protein